MVIKTWSLPIHEIQKGEVDRERTYLEQFFIFPGNIAEYIEFLDYVFTKLVSKNCPKTVRKYDEILHNIYKDNFDFDYHDIKNGQAPSDIIYKWASGRNCQADEKYSWKERRTSFRNEFFNDRMEDVSLVVSDALVEVANDTVFLIRENKKVVKKEINEGTYTPNKSEAASKSQKNNTEVLLHISGKDTKTVNADLKLNAEVDGKFDAEVKHQIPAEIKAAKLNELKEKMKEMEYD